MPDPSKSAPSDTNARPVAGNKTSTLAPTIVRLPLGEANKVTHPDNGRVSIFSLRNPTHFGGELTLQCEAASGRKMHLRRGLADFVLAESTTGEIKYAIPSGSEHVGAYHLFVEVPRATTSARLVQTGFSRQGPTESHPPFAPSNFWYWPTKTTHKRDPPKGTPADELEAWKAHRGDLNYWTYRARRVLNAFADLEGRASNDKLREWEGLHHQTDNRNASAWAGHCSWAAVASVLFEQPAQKNVGGFEYLQDDLELLGAEFSGVFAHTSELPDAYRTTRYPIDPSDLGVLDMLKPEGTNDEKELQAALADAFPYDKETQSEFIARFRRDYANTLQVKTDFGRKAAQFFVALQYELRGAWGVYIGDFRAELPDGNATEVWTHALFCYAAEFIEAAPVDNDFRYDVHCTLFCNSDAAPPKSAGLPAEIKGSSLKPIEDQCQVFKHQYRLSFDTKGEVIADGSGNPQWIKCQTRHGGDLLAPRYLKQVFPPLKTISPELQRRRDSNTLINDPQSGDEPIHHYGFYGNPLATWGLIRRGLLRLRARYR